MQFLNLACQTRLARMPSTPLRGFTIAPDLPVFAAFLATPFVFFAVPTDSVFARFTAGASSSSKAARALLRRVVARFVAIWSDCRGDLARTTVMSSVVTGSLVVSAESKRVLRSNNNNTRASRRRVQVLAAPGYYVGLRMLRS